MFPSFGYIRGFENHSVDVTAYEGFQLFAITHCSHIFYGLHWSKISSNISTGNLQDCLSHISRYLNNFWNRYSQDHEIVQWMTTDWLTIFKIEVAKLMDSILHFWTYKYSLFISTQRSRFLLSVNFLWGHGTVISQSQPRRKKFLGVLEIPLRDHWTLEKAAAVLICCFGLRLIIWALSFIKWIILHRKWTSGLTYKCRQ